MPRYNFGGTVYDIIPRPDTTAGGALKLQPGTVVQFYTTPTGGTVTTDYRLDPAGDNSFTQAVTSITVDSQGFFPRFQGPNDVSVLYHDIDPTDTNATRYLYVARDAAGAVGNATEATAGILPIASVVDARAGVLHNRTVTPLGLAGGVDKHAQDPNAHPDLDQAVAQAQAALSGKADKPVPIDQLPASEGAAGGTLITRRENGQAAVATALLDDEAVPLAQARDLLRATVGADVRHRPLLSAPASTSITAFTVVPDAVIPDAKSNDVWECGYNFHVRGTNAAGFQLRFRIGAAAVTNKLANPSLEPAGTVAPWTVSGTNSTFTRATAVAAQDGTAYGRIEAVSTAGTAQLVQSEWVPAGPGQQYTAGAYVRWLSGATPRGCRIDLQSGDATGTVLSTDVGTAVVPNTTTWQRVTNGLTAGFITPAGTTQVRVRLAIAGTPVVGDAAGFDAIQLEPGATLPAYGSTGGSGTSSLTIAGAWDGLTLAPSATPSEDYRRKVPIRYPTDPTLTAGFGLIGTTADSVVSGFFRVAVGGTNLSNQRLELEFAQRVAADTGNPTTIAYGWADFARVAGT